jgi:cell division protein FtsZ
MIRIASRNPSDRNAPGEPQIRIVGVGNAGANVLDRLALDGFPKDLLYCVNTDVQSLSASVAGQKIQIGWTITRGLGAGGDPEVGFDSAAEAATPLKEIGAGTDLIVLCLGLGGGTGSGAGPLVAEAARNSGNFVAAFVNMPFRFEGRRRMAQAIDGLARLRKACDAVIVFENDRMSELVDPRTGIHEAFGAADHILSQSVRSLANLVRRPGIMRVGLDGLLTVLKGNDPRCHYGYGEAQGPNRGDEALSAALRSPLLDRGKILTSACDVLVNISGGKDLSLAEVEEIMQALIRQASDKTHFLLGTTVDPRTQGKIGISILCSVDINPEQPAEPVRRRPQEESLAAEVNGRSAPAVSEEPEIEAEKVEEPEVLEEAAEEIPDVFHEEEDAPRPAPVAMPPRRTPQASRPSVPAASSEPASKPMVARPHVMKQEDFQFEPVSRGRFEKSEPTIVDGEDLDVPTFLRKNFRPRS